MDILVLVLAVGGLLVLCLRYPEHLGVVKLITLVIGAIMGLVKLLS